MAVVTGAIRTDIQLAALEASTHYYARSSLPDPHGVGEPMAQLISRAENWTFAC